MSWFDDDFYTETQKPPNRLDKQLEQKYHEKKETSARFKKIAPHFVIIFILVMIASSALAIDHHNQLENQENNQDLSYMIKQIIPTVVSIQTYQEDDSRGMTGYGIGSGVIYEIKRNQVMVVTNSHVVESGVKYEIVTYNGTTYPAQLIGADSITDLAVLKIETHELNSFAEFGDSEQLQVGETVIALGNPLGLGYSPAVTKGIISSLNRTIPFFLNESGGFDWEMEVIQTDAAINQGNSGGPLMNLRGQVIGINSSKISTTGVEGLGFAIPINDVKPILEDLMDIGKVRRAMMGISPIDLSVLNQSNMTLNLPKNVKAGVVIMEVSGSAKDAGLKPRDVIVKLDKFPIKNVLALRKYIFNEKSIGEQILVTFYRDGELKRTKLKLMERE
jgi:serine protease Do